MWNSVGWTQLICSEIICRSLKMLTWPDKDKRNPEARREPWGWGFLVAQEEWTVECVRSCCILSFSFLQPQSGQSCGLQMNPRRASVAGRWRRRLTRTRIEAQSSTPPPGFAASLSVDRRFHQAKEMCILLHHHRSLVPTVLSLLSLSESILAHQTRTDRGGHQGA